MSTFAEVRACDAVRQAEADRAVLLFFQKFFHPEAAALESENPTVPVSKAFVDKMASLCETGEGADIRLICEDGGVVPGHSQILRLSSKFIETMFSEPWASESTRIRDVVVPATEATLKKLLQHLLQRQTRRFRIAEVRHRHARCGSVLGHAKRGPQRCKIPAPDTVCRIRL
jgi:hypothetical protein